MIVQQFNIEGISSFVESDLVTEVHAHPALEIILARKGHFTLSTEANQLVDSQFVFIEPNIPHQLKALNCTVEIIMIEPGFGVLPSLLKVIPQPWSTFGIHQLTLADKSIINRETLTTWSKDPLLMKRYDERILKSIHFIKKQKDAKSLALKKIATHIHLSPDRLSHLFKEQIGIPIQKYIIWNRLKVAVNLMLAQQLNLTQAAYAAGFYDAAHFSRQFKEMLGVKPSAVYNSRIIQV